MITILQGKDMAAMDSNGKLGIGLPFSTDKVCNIRLTFVNILQWLRSYSAFLRDSGVCLMKPPRKAFTSIHWIR